MGTNGRSKFRDAKPKEFRLICPRCLYTQENAKNNDKDLEVSPGNVWGIPFIAYLVCPVCNKFLDYRRHKNEDLQVEITPEFISVDTGANAEFFAINFVGGIPSYKFRLQIFKNSKWSNATGWDKEAILIIKKVKNSDQGDYRLLIRDKFNNQAISTNTAYLQVN